MPPIEITSSSGCGEKQMIRRPIGSFDFPRIFAPSRLKTLPFTSPGEPNFATSDDMRASA